MKAVRGHRMAKATLENACWDLEAKKLGVPLWKHLGGTHEEISCGVSIGIQDSTEILLEKIRKEVDAGYQRIKIKIKPGWDVRVIERVRKEFPDIRLMGDANSAYTLADIPLFKELDSFNLMMLEQPLSHDDILDHARLQQEIKTAVCLDESIHHAEGARHAIEHRACRIINVKLGRVGGHSEAKRIEQVTRENSIPVWCGGMLESGIGRSHNIAMSTLAGFTLPGDVSASSRYWAEDIIEPPVIVSSRGTIKVPDAPGIGFSLNLPRIESLTVRKQTIKRAERSA
jgi:O-succinylbenzoate synthase